jgi:hypothetical protein
MGVCGLLAEHLGWASIFYVSGNSEKIKVKSKKTSTSF